MNTCIFADQKAFMDASGQKVSATTVDLYSTLVTEEEGELRNAVASYFIALHDGEDITAPAIEVADGCIDLIYVAVGLLHAMGFNPRPLWDEVHRSNIDKFRDGIRRREDGKILKPEGWTPPSLGPIVEAALAARRRA